MSTALTLYAIEEQFVALLDTEDLVPNDQQLAFLDDLASANALAVEKRDRLIGFLRHCDLLQEGLDKEIKRMQAFRDDYQRKQERVEKYVVQVIERFAPEPKRGAKRLEGSIGVLSLRKNPDHVEVTNPEAVPIEYRDVSVKMPAQQWADIEHEFVERGYPGFTVKSCRSEVRKSEVSDAIKAGAEIPGADVVFGQMKLVVR